MLTLRMHSGARGEVEAPSPAPGPGPGPGPGLGPGAGAAAERPWLFNFLSAPDAVISIGLINGALSYLLRNEGVDAARAASIVALLSLPHAIYFLWGPLTDFWMRRRTWLMLMAVAAAATLVAAFSRPRLAAPLAVALLFLAAFFGEFTVAACGGMMGTLRSEAGRRRAGSFYQSGSLAFGGCAVFLLVTLAARVRMETLGWMAAALVAVPAMAALAAPFQSSPSLPSPSQPSPSQPEPGSGRARATAARVWSEFRATFLRRDAIPYALLITFPMCSGAMLGLLPELARDYGVSGAQVAWMNGLGGALLTAAGALCASLTPLRVRAPIAFLLAGLVNAATLALLALAPLRPEVYFAGTVLFLFTIGACYAYFTGVALEFLGPSGKSGSGRYAIINSLGNLPVAYMSWIDGRGYARWGPRAMPGIDAAVSAAGAVVLLTWFVLERRNRFRPAR